MQEDSDHSLKQGSIIKNYEIIRVLGAGGFGITYLAKDTELNLKVVIKEYFPNEFAVRKRDSTIIAKTSSARDYAKGKLRFKEEAQVLARFNHPSIVKILGYFEANSTAYFVMEYEEGIDLAQYMKLKGKPFSQEEILTIMMPILEGLKEVHRYNYLHRDIKPGNILLKTNSSPVLIDFGATRIAVSDEQSKSVTSMLTEGYAPFEQYSTDLKQQGPFTDIYAIGAVMYKMITLETPVSSQTRIFQDMQYGNDPLNKLSSMNFKRYDPYFLKAIDKALESKPSNRQQNVEELQAELVKKKSAKSPKIDRKPTEAENSKSNKKDSNGMYIILLVFIASLIFYGYQGFKQKMSQQKKVQLEPKVEETQEVEETQAEEAPQFIIEVGNKIITIGNKMWQDEPYTNAEAKAYNDNEKIGKVQDWKGAMQYCQDLMLAEYSDWRLPSKETLEELYTHKSNLKNIDLQDYWSSTAVEGGHKKAWGVSFNRKLSYDYDYRYNSLYVRCVRDIQ